MTKASTWQLRDSLISSPVCLFLLVWSDDDWLKKFSGKTLEENKEEEGPEPPKAETQEVRRKVVPPQEDRLSFPSLWGLRRMCSQNAGGW